MSARDRGKNLERRVAELLGGIRQPNTGKAGPDVVVPGRLVVECKRVDEEGVRGAWIEQARGYGDESGLPWVVWKAVRGERRAVVVLDAAYFLVLYGLTEGEGSRGPESPGLPAGSVPTSPSVSPEEAWENEGGA